MLKLLTCLIVKVLAIYIINSFGNTLIFHIWKIKALAYFFFYFIICGSLLISTQSLFTPSSTVIETLSFYWAMVTKNKDYIPSFFCSCVWPWVYILDVTTIVACNFWEMFLEMLSHALFCFLLPADWNAVRAVGAISEEEVTLRMEFSCGKARR